MPAAFGSPGDGRRGLSELGGGPEGEDDGGSGSLRHVSSFESRDEQENLPAENLAGSTGFEPAVSALTGQRVKPGYTTTPKSGQQLYQIPGREKTWVVQDSNLRPFACKANALPLS